MTVQAKPITGPHRGPASWFRVCPGHACEVTLRIEDRESGQRVDWAGRGARFRVYSQYEDEAVVVEVTDSKRCVFEAEGVWRLQLTAQETANLPRGGMVYTLEHRDGQGPWRLGIRSGISCRIDPAETS